MTPRIVEKNEPAYKSLVAVAAMLEATSVKGWLYTVGETYFDLGQDWIWTTIICHEDLHEDNLFCKSFQVLCPRDWKAVCLANTVDELVSVVNVIKSDEYFSDK